VELETERRDRTSQLGVNVKKGWGRCNAYSQPGRDHVGDDGNLDVGHRGADVCQRGDVAAATEQLVTSVHEIGLQMTQSSKIASWAEEDAQVTDSTVQTLAANA
jgi:hypothetical protein